MIYERRGISQDFIDRIFTAKGDDLWYPTIDEMLVAGVIHEVVGPSTLKPIQYGSFNASELEDALKNIAALQTIKKYEPKTYQQIVNDMEVQMKKGASILEIQQGVVGNVQLIASKSLPKTSYDALIAFARELINVFRMLEKKEPILCMKNLFPDQYGSLVITKYLSNEEMMPMMDALNLAIVDSYEGSSNTKIDTAAAEELMSRVVVELGEDAGYLEAQGLKNREEYSKACKTVIRFYELVLRSNKKSAGNALRYAFAP